MNSAQREKILNKLNCISLSHHIGYPINPALKYSYPQINALIIRNIIHALICNKKFYTQVLHLMNKMNLPCPFEAHLFTYQIPDDLNIEQCELLERIKTQRQDKMDQDELMIEDSDDESEYESENEAACNSKQILESKVKSLSVKMLKKSQQTFKSKKSLIKDVFENVKSNKKGSIKLKISEKLPEKVDSLISTNGFGQIIPILKPNDRTVINVEPETIENEEFISLEELSRNILSQDELCKLPVYKNYERGEQSCRLYVKNLAKRVEESHLKLIYGRFINWRNEHETNAFDIRLMKEGRMKGQAFITFPDENKAKEALKLTNGYLLYDKPIIVQFARSAKTHQ